MALDVLLLAIGLSLLVAGGHWLVRGASQLAESLGVSELAIGLTVVAFGTSAPELSVNAAAALRGDSAISFGNVIGSNVANVGLVLGLCAVLRPLRFESAIVSREIPMMLLATVAAVILGLDRMRDAPEVYDLSDGLMLLLLFSLFLYYTVSAVLGERDTDSLTASTRGGPASAAARWLPAGLFGALGLALLLLGAQLTVSSASALAEAMGVPSVVIGLSVVAVGTSLPELVTSLVATSKGQTSLAVGNVVGSNIFNLLFILGLTSVVRPVAVPAVGGGADLAALVVFSVLLVPLSRAGDARVGRLEGGALVVAYLGYIGWRLGG